MLDKARLGTRYTCYMCQTKFYDLNREVPTCPECQADQREAPVRDIKTLLSGSGRQMAAGEEDEEGEGELEGEGDDETIDFPDEGDDEELDHEEGDDDDDDEEEGGFLEEGDAGGED